jgi:hypothetical protein
MKFGEWPWAHNSSNVSEVISGSLAASGVAAGRKESVVNGLTLTAMLFRPVLSGRQTAHSSPASQPGGFAKSVEGEEQRVG